MPDVFTEKPFQDQTLGTRQPRKQVVPHVRRCIGVQLSTMNASKPDLSTVFSAVFTFMTIFGRVLDFDMPVWYA
jgi:hypothetical protein